MKPSPKSTLPLMQRIDANRKAQFARVAQLQVEADRAVKRGKAPVLPSEDAQYLALRRQYDQLEREFERQNAKAKATSSKASTAGARTRKRKATPKPKRAACR